MKNLTYLLQGKLDMKTGKLDMKNQIECHFYSGA